MALPQFCRLIEAVSKAIPLGRYRPAPMPVINIPARIMVRLLHKPVMIKKKPVTIADRPMVFLCSSISEINPEQIRVIKYPEAETKKREPAWSPVRDMSCRIVGKSGDMIIRMLKFKKNIAVRKSKGRSCD